MNLAHVHLLLNHFPTIGTVIGLGLFLVSLVQKDDDLRRASLVVLLATAVLAVPAYLSGNAARQIIQDRPDVSADLIARHEDSALLALVFMEMTGAFAWLAVWQFRRKRLPARWSLSAVLLFSILTVALMTRTATMGGEIRHVEIRSNPDATTTASAVGSIASFIINQGWVWPASETLHFIGLCVLFGTVLTINLRILGIMKSVSLAALRGLLPWGLVAFGINVITGMLFFIATPTQYTENVAFHWKMVFMLLAGVNILYLTFDESWALEAGEDAPLTVKAIAAAGIFLWAGVIFFGRMLPYIGNAF